jgi:hypothetical protein
MFTQLSDTMNQFGRIVCKQTFCTFIVTVMQECIICVLQQKCIEKNNNLIKFTRRFFTFHTAVIKFSFSGPLLMCPI